MILAAINIQESGIVFKSFRKSLFQKAMIVLRFPLNALLALIGPIQFFSKTVEFQIEMT